MENQAATLLTTLKRTGASSETKLNLLNSLKSDIKKYNIPPAAQATIFECVKIAITQQASSTLASSAFSLLGHVIKRLKIQDASGHAIVQLAPRLFPPLQDRLGDLRESVRNAAAQALGEIYPFCSNDVEQIIRDETIGSTNVRAKEAGMRWVVMMHTEQEMPFKGYVSAIVARLEDADGGVREAAKSVLVELFSDAPDRAKTDLKRQMKAHSVRHAFETQILAQIGSTAASKQLTTTASGDAEADMTGSTRSLPTADHTSHLADSAHAEYPPPPAQEVVPMDPLYVHTQRELDDIFRDMLPCFEGKEDEHNWGPRDKSILKIRRILKGNAPNEFHASFMAGIKSMVEGILKASNTLRTTMSTNGCLLVQELARTLGPALDGHVEILLQSFIKMSAATKHIAAENGRITADTIFQHCSYSVRMMQHIWNAMQEKNPQSRQCATDWLKTILRRQASYKQYFESSGGLDLAEKCIKKGLDDANPKVKEGMRATYWTFAKTWTDRANLIMSKLDPKSKAALERDQNNPSSGLHVSQSSTVAQARVGVASGGGGSSSRSTLRELMAEQRKAKAAGKLPDRPNSAMADMTPARPKVHASNGNLRGNSNLRNETRTASTTSNAPAAKEKDSAASTNKGSLMSGPVRRPRRHEVQRPQTADPYASRRLLRPETPADHSPSGSPHNRTDASKASIPVSSVMKSRTKASATVQASPLGSPVRRSPHTGFGQPHSQMLDSRPTSKGSTMGHDNTEHQEEGDDDLTLVLPKGKTSQHLARGAFSPGHRRSGLGQSTSVDSGIPGALEDDGFTMVMPNLADSQSRARSPLAYRSPMRAMFEDARDKIGKLSPEAQRYVDHRAHTTPRPEERRGTPNKTVPDPQEEIQIYEDPFVPDAAQANGSEQRKVLGELPVNEKLRLTSPTQSHGSGNSPIGSPQATNRARSPSIPNTEDRSEIMRNRKLLSSGIERMRARTLDAHGFRRFQELAKSQPEIWDDGRKYNDLMTVLLDYLQSIDQEKTAAASSKIAGLKAQALALLRALLTLYRKFAVAWHPAALTTLLTCRRSLDSGNHLLIDLQRAADDIVQAAAPAPCLDAVSSWLETTPDNDRERSPAQIAMCLTVLRTLVTSDTATAQAEADADATEADEQQQQAQRRRRLARLAARHLGDADAEVRKADVELACALFEAFAVAAQPAAEFWSQFKGVDEGRLGLLTYYIAKRGRTAATTAAA